MANRNRKVVYMYDMPRYHGKDILEDEIEDLEARLQRSEKKFRDFKDEVKELIEKEIEKAVGKKVEERIKKLLGKEPDTTISGLKEKVEELDKHSKEVKKRQKDDETWWKEHWNDYYLIILEWFRLRSGGSSPHNGPPRARVNDSPYYSHGRFYPGPHGYLR